MNILAVGPHSDDIEIGCAGTLLRLQAEGAKVHYLCLSRCTDGQPAIAGESEAAVKKGRWETVTRLDYPNTRLDEPETARAIREDLEDIKSREAPAIVFCPTTTDIHQDHAAVTKVCEQVFRFTTLLGYETYKSGNGFAPSVFYELGPEHIGGKRGLLNCFKTQRERFDPEAILSLSRYRGACIHRDFAEAFEAIRIVEAMK